MSLIKNLSCGDTINNRYHLDVQIHQGRWGDVYRATDQVEERPVAVRLFPSAEDGPVDFDRFAAHARELSGLSTPIIATPIDHGQVEGVPFLIFRWARGQNLEDRLAERGPLSLDQTLTILEKILEGLDRAHDSRMTHGLLRPVKVKVDNLDSAKPLVKIVDFQIWRFFEWATGKDAFAESNISRRIVRYTSPEVLDEHRVKPGTDIYGAGLLTIELLTGEPAFNDNHRVALIARQMSDEPATLGYDVKAGDSFRQWVTKMVAKDQSERFSSAGKALQALRKNRDTFLSESPASPAKAETKTEKQSDEMANEEAEKPPLSNPDHDIPPGLSEGSGIISKKQPRAAKSQSATGENTSKSTAATRERPRPNDAGSSASGARDKNKGQQDQDQLFGDDLSSNDKESKANQLVDDEVEFGDFYKRSSLDADDMGGEGSGLLTLDEPSEPEPNTEAEASTPPDSDASRPSHNAPAETSDSPTGDDGDIIKDSSVPVSDASDLPSVHPASSQSRTKRALETKRKEKRNRTIGLVVGLLLLGGALVFVVQSDNPDEEVTDVVEVDAEDVQEDVPMHILRINTTPPAQRILIPGRTERMLSPIDVEIGENEFPLRIRARFDAETTQEEVVESPTDEEIHFDFSDHI